MRFLPLGIPAMLLVLLGVVASPAARAATINPTLQKIVADMQPGVWAQIPNTSVAPVLEETEKVLNGYTRGNSGPASVFYAWNGSAYDPKGMRWFFWGGGHQDYGGNEVYEFDFNTLAWTMLTKPYKLTPSEDKTAFCPVPPQSSGPAATHNYGGLVYSTRSNSVWLWNNAFPYYQYYCVPPKQNEFWEFNPDSKTWTGYQSITPNASGAAILDANGDPMFIGKLGAWHVDAMQKTANQLHGGDDEEINFPVAVVCDDFIWINNYSSLEQVSPKNFQRAVIYSVTGRAPKPPGTSYVFGLQCDPANRRLVFWGGTGTVVLYNIPANTWSTLEASGAGPTTGGSGGPETKWIYLAQLGVFAGYNNVKEGVWLIKLPSPSQLPAVSVPSYQRQLPADGQSPAPSPGDQSPPPTASAPSVPPAPRVPSPAPAAGGPPPAPAPRGPSLPPAPADIGLPPAPGARQ
jgi:hypothetical protein